MPSSPLSFVQAVYELVEKASLLSINPDREASDDTLWGHVAAVKLGSADDDPHATRFDSLTASEKGIYLGGGADRSRAGGNG